MSTTLMVIKYKVYGELKDGVNIVVNPFSSLNKVYTMYRLYTLYTQTYL